MNNESYPLERFDRGASRGPSSGELLNLEGQVEVDAGHVHLTYTLAGAVDLVAIPVPSVPIRRDDLWRRTCFELFARTGVGYIEFNLSPSGEWAAYRFEGYRAGMAELDVAPPRIRVQRTPHQLVLSAEIVLPERPTQLGLSAVIEETSGHKSYWALRHPPGDKPDFHHPDCFAIQVPPAGEA